MQNTINENSSWSLLYVTSILPKEWIHANLKSHLLHLLGVLLELHKMPFEFALNLRQIPYPNDHHSFVKEYDSAVHDVHEITHHAVCLFQEQLVINSNSNNNLHFWQWYRSYCFLELQQYSLDLGAVWTPFQHLDRKRRILGATSSFADSVHIGQTEEIEFLNLKNHLVLSVHIVKRGIGDDCHDIVNCSTFCYLSELLDNLWWRNESEDTFRIPM